MQDARKNKRLVKNEVLDDNTMISEYMPFYLSNPNISERDAHLASRPVILMVRFCPFSRQSAGHMLL